MQIRIFLGAGKPFQLGMNTYKYLRDYTPLRAFYVQLCMCYVFIVDQCESFSLYYYLLLLCMFFNSQIFWLLNYATKLHSCSLDTLLKGTLTPSLHHAP